MTIRTDLDAAIDKVQALGVGLAAMRLRMGPSARAALVADRGTDGEVLIADGEPIGYRGVPIMAVDHPTHDDPESADRFHGFELIA